MSANLDGLLEAAVQRGAVPGAAAVLAGPEGLRDEGAAGVLSVGGDVPVTADTMFRFASMTKALTSVACLQLVEQGRVGLDDQVASVIPEFGDLQVLDGFGDDGQPRLRPPARQATVGELLNHTSGHGYWFSSEDLVRYHEVTGVPNPLSGLKAGLAMPLVADPGTRWEYGISTDWVGQVVEAISGTDLASYLAENLFGPLGMTDATFAPSDEQRARMMQVHHRTPDGGLVAGDLDLPEEAEFWPGGHGTCGTARDYARFLSAMLGGGELDGERVLKAETVELAFTDRLGGIALPELIRTAIPELCNDIPSLPFRQGWGLGFHLVLEDIPGMRRAGTGDWAGLFNCYYWIDRATGIAGAFLTQVLPFFDQACVETALGLEAATYAEVGAAPAA